MDDKKLETIVKNSGRKISFMDWLFMKNKEKNALDVPRNSFDYLNDTAQTA